MRHTGQRRGRHPPLDLAALADLCAGRDTLFTSFVSSSAGIVAAVMALGRAMARNEHVSVYETRGIISL